MNEANQPSSIKAQQFKDYLALRKEEVEHFLWSLLPKPDGMAARLNEAMRYPLEAGGKRIRPILILMGSDFCRGVSGKNAYAGQSWHGVDDELKKAILTTACSIEMIHTYSLVHDDLPCMDDDDLRRGRPTSHKVYGEAMAVLSADALHTLGFQLIASTTEKYALQGLRAIRELAVACGYPGMVAGQVVDLEYEHKKGDETVLEYIHLHKTAALIRASLLMGAQMVLCNKRDYELLFEVGTKLGLIFQVVDDILDVVGDTNILGKKAGSDESHEKLTYPSLIGLEASRERVHHLRNDIVALLKDEGERAQPLLDLTDEFLVRQT